MMRITYDPEADAAYFYVSIKIDLPDTRQIDSDINLDFDENDRLVGIEVLDASKRLDLEQLLPYLEIIGREEPGRTTLRVKLLRYKQEGTPLHTRIQKKINWVEKIQRNAVWVKREESGKVLKITREDLDNMDEEWHRSHLRLAIVQVLWDIGNYE